MTANDAVVEQAELLSRDAAKRLLNERSGRTSSRGRCDWRGSMAAGDGDRPVKLKVVQRCRSPQAKPRRPGVPVLTSDRISDGDVGNANVKTPLADRTADEIERSSSQRAGNNGRSGNTPLVVTISVPAEVAPPEYVMRHSARAARLRKIQRPRSVDTPANEVALAAALNETRVPGVVPSDRACVNVALLSVTTLLSANVIGWRWRERRRKLPPRTLNRP